MIFTSWLVAAVCFWRLETDFCKGGGCCDSGGCAVNTMELKWTQSKHLFYLMPKARTLNVIQRSITKRKIFPPALPLAPTLALLTDLTLRSYIIIPFLSHTHKKQRVWWEFFIYDHKKKNWTLKRKTPFVLKILVKLLTALSNYLKDINISRLSEKHLLVYCDIEVILFVVPPILRTSMCSCVCTRCV